MSETNTNELFNNSEELKPILDLIQNIMELNEEDMSDSMKESIIGMINGALPMSVKKESIATMIKNFENQGLTRNQAFEVIKAAKSEFTEYIDMLKPSAAKREILNSLISALFEIFDTAVDKYHNYDIRLPVALEPNAIIPTYAHASDAAADLYAKETVVLPAHSNSNMINTGVRIALPEGWMAMIFPRSSIGAKTGLRLSNSCGIIDSAYRGPLGVLYDNISDSDYTVNAGDRIAQLLVMPSYHFKPELVDKVPETERGEGGFGSTGV